MKFQQIWSSSSKFSNKKPPGRIRLRILSKCSFLLILMKIQRCKRKLGMGLKSKNSTIPSSTVNNEECITEPTTIANIFFFFIPLHQKFNQELSLLINHPKIILLPRTMTHFSYFLQKKLKLIQLFLL